jgi:hypothetical protein
MPNLHLFSKEDKIRCKISYVSVFQRRQHLKHNVRDELHVGPCVCLDGFAQVRVKLTQIIQINDNRVL